MVAGFGSNIDEAPSEIQNDIGLNKENSIAANVRVAITRSPYLGSDAQMKMSALLEKLLLMLKSEAIDYKQFLSEVRELVSQIKEPAKMVGYPQGIDTRGRQDLYAMLGNDASAAIAVDSKLKAKCQSSWREHKLRRRKMESAVIEALEAHLSKTISDQVELEQAVESLLAKVMEMAFENNLDYPS